VVKIAEKDIQEKGIRSLYVEKGSTFGSGIELIIIRYRAIHTLILYLKVSVLIALKLATLVIARFWKTKTGKKLKKSVRLN